MRWRLALLVAAILAGCASPAPSPPAPEPEPVPYSGPWLLALDGRWAIDVEAAARFAEVEPRGAVVIGEGIAEGPGGPVAYSFIGADAVASAILVLPLVEPGSAVLSEAFARRSGASVGDDLTLRAWTWPVPYVATFWEMERLQRCSPRAEMRACFLEPEGSNARIRMRVGTGARDFAFLPDIVELGARGTPAWWNGTLSGPDGASFAIAASVGHAGADPKPAERIGELAQGEWIVSYKLEANGTVAAPGAAGILRVREPGYGWFDDRLQPLGGAEQARAVLEDANGTKASVRVAGLNATLRADVVVDLATARALAGMRDGEAGGIVLAEGRAVVERLAEKRNATEDSAWQLLHARPFVERERAGGEGPLLFRAPADVDLAALPPVPGGGAPSLAIASRPPVGEGVAIDRGARGVDALLLAHAAGPPPWRLETTGRWPDAETAAREIAAGRTLALAGPEMASDGAPARVALGDDWAARTAVLIARIEGGPAGALWLSPSLVSSVGEPVGARVILPIAQGADREVVRMAATQAWAPFGIAPEP